jgi:hypothetical protein
VRAPHHHKPVAHVEAPRARRRLLQQLRAALATAHGDARLDGFPLVMAQSSPPPAEPDGLPDPADQRPSFRFYSY